MSKLKKVILAVTIVASLILGIGAWQLYQVLNYNVTEEQLGVEEDFFDLSKDIQIPMDELNTTTETPEIHNEDIINGEINEEIVVNEEISKEVAVNEVEVNQDSTDKNKEIKIEAKQQAKQQEASKDIVKVKSSKEEIESIRNKYYPVFKQLQTEAVNRLDRLYANAKKEYNQKRKNANFSKKEFASKYISASKKLEDAVNQVFYQTLDSMKKELKNKDLPLDLANEAEQTYKQLIKSKKAKMIDQYL